MGAANWSRRAMVVAAALEVAITIFLSTTWVVLYYKIPMLADSPINRNYTYIGHDYPLEYPLDKIDRVAMTLHESIHLSLNLTDDLANKEWDTMDKRRHWGNTHQGPEFRALSTVFGHQLHCLRFLHIGMLTKYGYTPDDEPGHHHWQHCLNYLRQTFLCDAVGTLEKEIG